MTIVKVLTLALCTSSKSYAISEICHRLLYIMLCTSGEERPAPICYPLIKTSVKKQKQVEQSKCGVVYTTRHT